MAENRQGLNLETVMPLLLLASPLIEAGNPGVGMNLASGVLNYQRDKKERQNRILFGLAKDFADLGDENKDVVKALMKNAGIEPEIFDAAWAARTAFADPHAATNKYLDEMITGVIGGQEFTGPRRLIQPSQIESAQRGEIAGREQNDRLSGEARQQLLGLSLDPLATPQAQARARQLLQQLQQGADPQTVIAEIPQLAGMRRQESEPQRRARLTEELRSLANTGVAGTAPRIKQIATALGIDPNPYLAILRAGGQKKGELLKPDQIVNIYEKAWGDALRIVGGAKTDPLAMALAISQGANPAEILGQSGLSSEQIQQVQEKANVLVGNRLRAAGYRLNRDNAIAVAKIAAKGVSWDQVHDAVEQAGEIPELYYFVWKQNYKEPAPPKVFTRGR